MPTIRSIGYRKVLNSQVEFTNEFIVYLNDGSIGIGAAPKGETLSIYEESEVSCEPENIIQSIDRDGYIGKLLKQVDFDNYLNQRFDTFGRNNAYGLSLAFFNAANVPHKFLENLDNPVLKFTPPYICCNILNGGGHAYTNPVLSDFPEFLLVSKSNNIEEIIKDHNEIQRVVKEKLIEQTKTIVSGNPVSCFSTTDNRECIEFLLNVCYNLGLSEKFDLMIDASGGDLWTDQGYLLAITDGSVLSSEEFYEYWMEIINQYDLRYIEDPFHEKDMENWHRLTNSQQSCNVIGDNFYSSDTERIKIGAAQKYTHGVIVKPNQAGTVTAIQRAIKTAQCANQITITSHRSISTESLFLSMLTCTNNVKYIKIGPLMTDYSSVIRLNEIIRLTEDLSCQ